MMDKIMPTPALKIVRDVMSYMPEWREGPQPGEKVEIEVETDQGHASLTINREPEGDLE